MLLEHQADLGDVLEAAATGALVEAELEGDLGDGQERELFGEVRSVRSQGSLAAWGAGARCHGDIVRQGCHGVSAVIAGARRVVGMRAMYQHRGAIRSLMVACACIGAATACGGGGDTATTPAATGSVDTVTESTVVQTSEPSQTTNGAPPTTADPAETTMAPTTTEPPVVIPAGVVLEPTGTFPPGFFVADVVHDGTGYLAAGAVQVGDDLNARVAAIATSPDLTAWTVEQIPDPVLSPPNGYPDLVVGYSAGSVVATDRGTVLVGDSGWLRGTEVVSLDPVWFRPPGGGDWAVADVRSAAGMPAGALIVDLYEVNELDGTFVLAGAASTSALDSPSLGVVLVSTDGVTWSASTLAGTWSVYVDEVVAVDGAWVAFGGEYVCDAESKWMDRFGSGPQTRVWRSTDRGATWSVVAIPPEVRRAGTEPPDPAACPEYNHTVYESAYADRLIGGVVGGEVVLWSADRLTTASSSGDLASWTPAVVPSAGATYALGNAQAVLAPDGVATLFSQGQVPGVSGLAHEIWVGGPDWVLQPRNESVSAGSSTPHVVGDAIVFTGPVTQTATGVEVYVSRATVAS